MKDESLIGIGWIMQMWYNSRLVNWKLTKQCLDFLTSVLSVSVVQVFLARLACLERHSGWASDLKMFMTDNAIMMFAMKCCPVAALLGV